MYVLCTKMNVIMSASRFLFLHKCIFYFIKITIDKIRTHIMKYPVSIKRKMTLLKVDIEVRVDYMDNNLM